MARAKQYRHTTAFLLLFLQEGPAYGAQLLGRLRTELPHCFCDSPCVYRTLQEMEDKGLVLAQWKTGTGGAPRKYYRITPQGTAALREEALDISQRHANLGYFLERYPRSQESGVRSQNEKEVNPS